jgi:hypothetical protein
MPGKLFLSLLMIIPLAAQAAYPGRLTRIMSPLSSGGGLEYCDCGSRCGRATP